MRWLLSFFLLTLLGIVQALSSTGNRLLVVIEEAAEKSKYSKFWTDLEGESHRYLKKVILWLTLLATLGRGYKLYFESPKSEKLALFEHGEREYDHIILLPPKSKGTSYRNKLLDKGLTWHQGLDRHSLPTYSFNLSTKMATSS